MINIILLEAPGLPELLLILVVILLLFGGKKIPELMRGLGQGIKEFKKASRADDDHSSSSLPKQDEKEKGKE
jgi:sec-independent protein translocase protein TatA